MHQMKYLFLKQSLIITSFSSQSLFWLKLKALTLFL